MLSFSSRGFISFIVSSLLFFTIASSHAQNNNTNSLSPILSLILDEPEATTIIFDTPTEDGVFIVPNGVTSINVTALGASGGNGDGNGDGDPGASFVDENGEVQFITAIIPVGGTGGAGGRSSGTIAVTPGEQLDIIIGSQGGSSNEGLSRGGDGGGRSEILRNGTALIVAGGGGGGGGGNRFNGGNGGAGGGLSGSNGDDASSINGVTTIEDFVSITTGLAGEGAEGGLGGQGTTLIVGQNENSMFGVLIQGTDGSGPGEEIDLDGVPDILGAPVFGEITFGGTGSGVISAPFASGLGGGGRASTSGGGGGGYAGGSGGAPIVLEGEPLEDILFINSDGEEVLVSSGNEFTLSGGSGGGGGSSFIPEGGSTEAGVNIGNGSIIISYW